MKRQNNKGLTYSDGQAVTPAVRLLQAAMQTGGCDLHLHTTCSDGSDTPEHLISRVLEAGLKTFAVTDHDTIDAIESCKTYLSGLRNQGMNVPHFIPGVEVSADDVCELHILGYYPNGGIEKIAAFLEEQQHTRQQRNVLLADRLQALGYSISLKEMQQMSKHSTGRMQAALLLMKKGYVKSVSEAFDKLLSEGRPAYIKRQRVNAKAVIDTINTTGGVSVLAHPNLYGWCDGETLVSSELLTHLKRLREMGLHGVEAFHGQASLAQQQEISAAARAVGLLRTAGSDDHGSNKDKKLMYHGSHTWLNEHELLVVSALISQSVKDDTGKIIREYLLARRSETGNYKGFWEMPGGKIKCGENAVEALKRELCEELAVSADIGRLQYVIHYDYPDQRVILLCYEAVCGPHWQLCVHDAIGYFSPQNALSLKLLPADIALFKRLR